MRLAPLRIYGLLRVLHDLRVHRPLRVAPAAQLLDVGQVALHLSQALALRVQLALALLLLPPGRQGVTRRVTAWAASLHAGRGGQGPVLFLVVIWEISNSCQGLRPVGKIAPVSFRV